MLLDFFSFHFLFLTVSFAFLKDDALGAPAALLLFIFSPLPALIRALFAWMLEYKPRFAIYYFLEVLPEHFHLLRDRRKGELGSLAAAECFVI